MAKISLCVENECLFSSVTTLIDGFSIANIWHREISGESVKPLFETELLTTDGLPVTAHGGIQITPDRSIEEVKETDCIVISPFLPGISPVPDNIESLYKWVKQMRNNGALITTGCTGTFILAEMGILDGKKATTNWQYAKIFKKRYPKVKLAPECMLTEDDGILCTGAASAVFNLGMYLIKWFGSEKLARLCSKSLLVDPNRHSQAPYMISSPLKNHGDHQVLKAQQLIEETYAQIDSIDDLARKVGISSRHFKRRFKQATGDLPSKYLQRVRIESAKQKLESTNETIDEITWKVGYQDTSSFCRLFKQYTKISPKAYRERFMSLKFN